MFYILNTCSDYALKEVLGVIRRVISVTAIVVPILLIVGGTITLIKGILNPDDKKTFKTFTNAIASAVIVFLLPFLVNITMGIISSFGDVRINEGGSNVAFDISSCWTAADAKNISSGDSNVPISDEANS